MIIKVTRAEETKTQKGSECLKATGQVDGKEKTVFAFLKVKEKWPLLKAGATVELVYSEDGKWITDIREISEKAVEKVEPPKLWEDKIRSMSLSYAKDVVLGDKWELQSIGYLAAQFEKYLNHTLTAAELDTKIREKSSTLKTE